MYKARIFRIEGLALASSDSACEIEVITASRVSFGREILVGGGAIPAIASASRRRNIAFALGDLAPVRT